MRTVFLDTETTGLKVLAGDRVIEVGAVAYRGRERVGGEEGKFHVLVDPGRSISKGATNVHGITDKDLAGKQKFAQIAGALFEFVRGAELVLHNAEFDLGFLNRELKIAGFPSIAEIVEKVTDTLPIARRKFPGGASLEALCLRYRIDVHTRRPVHSALVDAELLSEVYMHLTSGQSSLKFAPVAARGRSGASSSGPIPVVLLSKDPAAARLHKEYMDKLKRKRPSF